MNFRDRNRSPEEPEINFIPLIDVLLVILIFLMITTTYSKYTELQINLPTADAEKQLERPNEINVAVSSLARYSINGQAVAFRDVNGLSNDLKAAATGKKDPVIVISADAQAPHQSVIHVMQAAQLAGLGQVTFTTQATPGK
ncbi:MAG: biopolymer transporter ExbD [Burkholderiales bacterium]|nr:biopolymer transporter ExbD [Burkholderiales bacterium]